MNAAADTPELHLSSAEGFCLKAFRYATHQNSSSARKRLRSSSMADGRDVELVTAGTGERTVVFESGLGSDWRVWDARAVEVARSTRVFAYSRPGAGRSAPAGGGGRGW